MFPGSILPRSIILFFFYTPELSGGPLSDEYTLIQFHAHWGSDDSKGAEHTINGRQYSAEVKAIFLILNTDAEVMGSNPISDDFFSFHKSKITSKVLLSSCISFYQISIS